LFKLLFAGMMDIMAQTPQAIFVVAMPAIA
jgi:hypothetical protein